jgi:hypothetical protein
MDENATYRDLGLRTSQNRLELARSKGNPITLDNIFIGRYYHSTRYDCGASDASPRNYRAHLVPFLAGIC